MCRLLGYVAETPVSMAECLGTELDTFNALTAVHGDGWGMAWHPEHETSPAVATSPANAATDQRYENLSRTRLGAAGLVHLRWATDGLPVSSANTHPFVEGGAAFAHNGSIVPRHQLESLLSPADRERLLGDTDSERYFRFVLDRVAAAGDEASGVRNAVDELASTFPHASLNALLLTDSTLYAIHYNSRASSPAEELREMFGSVEAMPRGHGDEYFAMAYRRQGNAVHVVSSGLSEQDWIPVPAETVLSIDLASRQITML